MKHNIIPKALRWMAAASLCLAAVACSKDDIAPESAPQQGITPTKFIFNVTRSGYEGETETRAPKDQWEEGDVVYFGIQGAIKNTATYTGGEWVVQMNSSIPDNPDYLYGIYAESGQLNINGHLDIGQGEVALTSSGNYKVSEGGVATITLNLNQHPQGRMTFTGIGQGKDLYVEGMQHVSLYNTNTADLEFKSAVIFRYGREDGTATIYGLPTSSIVSGSDITLKVRYNGVWYKKTFVNKVFEANSNITLAAPSVENGWTVDYIEYGASDLKLGDYYYSDGTWSDGGLRKLYPDGKYEAETITPSSGKRPIGIVIYAGRHASDNSDYTKALTEGGPTLSGNINGYAMAITDATEQTDRPIWLIGPGGAANYIYNLDSYVSTNQYAWNGYANCQGIHNFVKDHADESFEMRHFQAAWVCEIYGYRNWDYDGSVNGNDYGWQQSLKAPAGTSGWFLPSIGQLAYMHTNVNYLNKRLETVKENFPDGYSCKDRIVPFNILVPYWSSTTVSGNDQSACVRFLSPSQPQEVKTQPRNGRAMARPILVF